MRVKEINFKSKESFHGLDVCKMVDHILGGPCGSSWWRLLILATAPKDGRLWPLYLAVADAELTYGLCH